MLRCKCGCLESYHAGTEVRVIGANGQVSFAMPTPCYSCDKCDEYRPVRVGVARAAVMVPVLAR